MLKPSIFREYDIRGIADEELLDAGCRVAGPRASDVPDPLQRPHHLPRVRLPA